MKSEKYGRGLAECFGNHHHCVYCETTYKNMSFEWEEDICWNCKREIDHQPLAHLNIELEKIDKREWECPKCGSTVKVVSEEIGKKYYGSKCIDCVGYKTPPTLSSPPTKTELRKQYKKLVWKLTNEQNLSVVEGIEKREWRKYDLDHIVPIYIGFQLNINPHLIASTENLQILPHRENIRKGVNVRRKGKELLEEWGMSSEALK